MDCSAIQQGDKWLQNSPRLFKPRFGDFCVLTSMI